MNPRCMSSPADVVIIGAGIVVGLALAGALQQRQVGLQMTVLQKERCRRPAPDRME
jgi:L-2-hydroxyglutarate oxidase LhgO